MFESCWAHHSTVGSSSSKRANTFGVSALKTIGRFSFRGGEAVYEGRAAQPGDEG